MLHVYRRSMLSIQIKMAGCLLTSSRQVAVSVERCCMILASFAWFFPVS